MVCQIPRISCRSSGSIVEYRRVREIMTGLVKHQSLTLTEYNRTQESRAGSLEMLLSSIKGFLDFCTLPPPSQAQCCQSCQCRDEMLSE